MKREYKAPLATILSLHTEGLLAGSIQVTDEDEITDRGQIGAPRKRGWGTPAPWEAEEE